MQEDVKPVGAQKTKKPRQLSYAKPHDVEVFHKKLDSIVNKIYVVEKNAEKIRPLGKNVEMVNIEYLPGGVPTISKEEHKTESSKLLTKSSVPELSFSHTLNGFCCETCKIVSKNFTAHLDHINSKKHQKAIGNVIHIEDVTVSQVRAKMIEIQRRNKLEKIGVSKASQTFSDYVSSCEAERETERKRKEEKKEEKKERIKQQRLMRRNEGTRNHI